MITITHDMLGAYEVIAAGILGSHFHPEIGYTIKDLIFAHFSHLDDTADLLNTEEPIKLVTYDYKNQELKTDMAQVEFKIISDRKSYFIYKYTDGTVIEDKEGKILPVAIIKD